MSVDVRPRIEAVNLACAPDPYPTYARMRAEGAVLRGEFGQWLVTRHAEISALLRDPRLASEFPRDFIRIALGGGPAAEFLDRIVLTRDPPAHTKLRRFMGQAFGTTAMRAMRGSVADLVDGALDPGLERGHLDLVQDVALPVPVTVVCRLIGIPDADRPRVVPEVIALAKIFDAANLTQSTRDRAVAALGWLRTYLAELLADDTTRLGEHTLAAMYRRSADRDGGAGIGVEEFIDNLLFLFHAGFETTMGLIPSGCRALLAHPDQFDRLRREPGLVPRAIDEFLRYDAPIQNTVRVAQAPIEIAGVKIRAGRSVMLLLGSGNRDERVFHDPDRLDVARDHNPHLGFGGGLHHCLGMVVARLMGELVFDRLVRRCRVIEPAGPDVRRPHGSLRGFEHLPIRVVPA